MGDPGEEVSDEKYRVATAIEEEALSLPYEEMTLHWWHMNNCTYNIDEEDKAVILLNSLPDEEYETFTLTLINGRQTLNYSEVSIALVNYEVRRQDKLFF